MEQKNGSGALIKVICKFCEKRIVKQQEWKSEFEKKHCMTCYVFIKFAAGIEKSLQEQMTTLGIVGKTIKIEIRKTTSIDRIAEVFGLGTGLNDKLKNE